MRIDHPSAGDQISGTVTTAAPAWDDWSRMDKVIFKLGTSRLDVVNAAPFTTQRDTTGYAAGTYTIKATAVDKAGNRRTRTVKVTLADAVPALPPVDPTPPLPNESAGAARWPSA